MGAADLAALCVIIHSAQTAIKRRMGRKGIDSL